MQKRGAGFFNRAVERGRTDVDFVSPLVARLPNLAAGEMSIRADCLFQTDYKKPVLLSYPAFIKSPSLKSKYHLQN